ncbi:Retrovirus-related Pol polyprotein from transposon opus [Vitis vinifera]|uniref:RNA-directed DNA polymerase n=1 Tax=Vitis vinifera TaxID=29760 RepID=A0A438GP02_VITVI|nr:Retrovirus-related Pol polyprotein from transposon opus [Vitis vinifera]
MCGGDFMSKNPEEAMDFLSYVAEVSRDGMNRTKENKVAAMTRRLEELELKKIHEVQAVAETPVQVKPCPICQSYEHLVEECPTIPAARKCLEIKQMSLDNSSPTTMLRMEILTTQVGGIIQISHGSQEHLSIPTASSTISTSFNLEQAIVNLSKVRDVKALITLRSGKKVELPTPKPHVKKEEEEETKKREEIKGKKKDISEGKEDHDSTVNANPEKVLKGRNVKKHTSTFSSSFAWEKGIRNASEILEVLRQVKVNIPLLDMIKQVPTYAKFLKDLCTIKRGLNVNKKAFLTEQVSAIIQCKSPLKYKDPGCPTISVMIGGKVVEKALLDLGASVNLLPYSVYKQLGLGVCLLEVLKRCKKAIGWQISDLKGIVLWYYLPISDSPWVSPTQVVPKKSGIMWFKMKKEKNCYTPHFRLEDQEKTTFTCPFGTYAYRRMPFGLCNAPATFQRCMLSIFSDMVERIMEVFMDDITIYGGIVLGHIISEKGIEVDKAKVELIVKLPSPTTVKGELVLGQREDGKPYVIYYASKTLNEAQRNYTTTEKELLAVVFALDKFRAYLVGSFIIVFTDHSALKYLLTKQDAKASEWKAQDRKHFFAKIHAYYWEEPFLFKYCADQIIRKCVPEEEQQGILSHCHESACGGHFASRK